ncbi:glycosyltransferase family 1 protein [Pelagicoccus sp. NFK12]|uniref:Glycosyltransferase family 1 protein n=1 Tax=Pelagicoccus enzymogenes TaxID=2773457 RepID=A0A927F5C3_9BACT|nr:glycosyltransferase family 1 protein [Pelagicoccus enzymogenes]MBD5778742.1 glycosyltransferase family 1 protein [Pelagicoccus enzymogenes]MDQ8197511.1 glycosyltransferase family 1 protein [Pelagicoccus enzymogenes]
MKLALVTETYPPEINGVAMTLSQLVSGLRDKGHRVQVVRPLQTSEKGDPKTEPDTITVFGLPIPRYPDLRFGLPSRNRLIHAWQSNRPDIVHVATEGPLGLSAIRAAKSLGIPTTSTFHTNFHSYSEHYNAKFATRIVLAFLRWIHNQTRCTMAPTLELAKQLAAEGFRNMEVFGRGVNLKVFNPQARDENLRRTWGAAPDTPVFIHVSRLAAEKNYDLLQKAYSEIRYRRPDAKFVVIGSGPMEKKLKQDLPFATFPGSIPLENRPELARYYASADAFLYPSKTETYGNVATEAMASGNALVAFDYAAPAQHVRQGLTGLISALDDDAGFVASSLAVATDDSLREKLGQAAAAYAPAFDWQPIVDRFEAILLRTIAS